MILIVDFGSQTAHLIERRVRDLGVETKFVPPAKALQAIKKYKPHGIILSGGPASVYAKHAPTVPADIFSLGIPLLAICYGMQFMVKTLGGKVAPGQKEYGPSQLKVHPSVDGEKFKIIKGLPKQFTVWMSHGDAVESLPEGFTALGRTEHAPYALVANKNKKLFGTLFHPEIEHTENGDVLLRNFITLCESPIDKKVFKVEPLIKAIRTTVGDKYVIGAVSGGVDSTVASALAAKAIGKQYIPIYVENGLMRAGTTEHVKEIFKNLGIVVDIVDVQDEMLVLLKGVKDPERKRKLIGNLYIHVFEREMEKLLAQGYDVQFLLQGTIYSDVIESKGTKHAAKIKSHHNVGGLPKYMKLKLLEPLRTFYKDEVRSIGKHIGLPDTFVWKQVFPGPGYAIRIRGEVTPDRLAKAKQADEIVLEELEKAGILPNVYMSFPVMTGADSTAVKGDGRFFGEVIALRIIESKDIMSTTWARIPYDVLQSIASRIVNEVPEISRVVYDITTKPPATMEWE